MVGEPGSAQNGATPAQAASNGDRKSTSHSRQPSQASQSGSGVQRRPSQSSQPGVQRKPSQSSKSGDKPQQRGADLAPTQVQAQGAGAAAAAGPAKKSGAELKAQKQAEKAARRAQAKESKAQSGAGAAQQGSGGPWAADKGKGSKAEDHQHQQQQSKAGGQHGGGGGGGGTAAGGQQAVKGAAPPTVGGSGKHLAADQAAAVPQCFAHFSVARRIQPSRVDRDIHPAILLLGQQMATLRMTDGTERLHATLLAFKQVISSYSTPAGSSLSRHFTSHVLNPQIEYLTECRPMSFAMGNGVRWLKQQLTDVDIDLGEDEAKELLLRAVDAFVDERIVAASAFTVGHAVDKIRAPAASSLHGGSSGSGEVVLTLGGHRLVERTLLQAHEAGKQLAGVVVVDADPATDASGLAMAKRLVTAGITGVRYAPNLLAIDGELASGVTLVLLGAESILADGSMYARAGSCDVAVAASDAGVDVLALCETINFADRITLEASAGINEMHPEHKTDTDFMALFDVTPPRYLSQVAIESGCASPGELYSVVRRNT